MSFDIQHKNIVNINKDAPLLNFSVSSSELIPELIDIIDKIKEEKKPKTATVYSVKNKIDIIIPSKRVSSRISTKDYRITNILNKYLFKSIPPPYHQGGSFSLLDHHYDIVSYKKGGFFKKHRDYQWFYSTGRIQMSCLIGLKDTNKGGGTYIWYPKSFSKFKKEKEKLFDETSKKGGVIIFPSHWYHAGKKIIEGEKEILFINLNYKIPENSIHNDFYYLKKNKKKDNKIINITTIDNKKIEIDIGCLRDTLLEIEIDFNRLQGKKILVDYSSDEIDILIKYITNYNIPLHHINSYTKNPKYRRKYLDIIQKETQLLPESIIIGLISNISTMKMVDNLLTKKTKCGIWSSYISWSFEFVNQKNNFIPFVIINEYVDTFCRNTFFSLYNFNIFSEEDILSFGQNIYKNNDKFWKFRKLKKQIEYFITSLQNSHLKHDFVSSEKKHIIPNKVIESEIIKNKNQKGGKTWVNIAKKKKKGVYNIPLVAFNKEFGNTIKEIYNYLEENSIIIESSTSEVERYKNRYYTLVHNDYDYDDYDDDKYCNGYDDEYGGYHRKYATQLITVRYGLYRTN